jgi:hypothetical protein
MSDEDKLREEWRKFCEELRDDTLGMGIKILKLVDVAESDIEREGLLAIKDAVNRLGSLASVFYRRMTNPNETEKLKKKCRDHARENRKLREELVSVRRERDRAQRLATQLGEDNIRCDAELEALERGEEVSA